MRRFLLWTIFLGIVAVFLLFNTWRYTYLEVNSCRMQERYQVFTLEFYTSQPADSDLTAWALSIRDRKMELWICIGGKPVLGDGCAVAAGGQYHMLLRLIHKYAQAFPQIGNKYLPILDACAIPVSSADSQRIWSGLAADLELAASAPKATR